MKTINRFCSFVSIAIALLAFAPAGFAQVATAGANAPYSTTLSVAQTQTANTVTLASITNLSINNVLYIDGELEQIAKTWNGASTTVPVSRYAGQSGAHVANAIVLFGPPKWFYTYDPTGACPTPIVAGGATPSTVYVSPWINTKTGSSWRCYAGQWGKVGVFFVSPYNCNWIPTTLTQTTTYPVVGLGATTFTPVTNSVTNAAAGTDTLNCVVQIPADVASGRSNLITDITVTLGSQVVAPTSIGTATLGSITFPAPVATTQTATTQTATTLVGGAVTQLGPTTSVLSVTTAGDFLTFNYSFASPVDLTTDLRMLIFQLPILQSAASAMTLNSAGLFVHYIHRQ